MMRARALLVAAASMAVVLAASSAALAEFPYPGCGGCPDPNDYQDYLFNPVNNPPIIPSEVGALDFRVSSLVDPSLPNTPEELYGVAGMSVDLAWQTTTGRPDVVIAILDSGVIYSADLANKGRLNPGELPLPEGSLVYDANGDGVFNVQDYASDSRVSDLDGNGVLDPRDLIHTFSDGVDDDANGYTDDICGWDMHEHDNDPFDDVDYGHGTGEAKGSVGEVNNGGGWGVAPSAMFIPVKVSDSFIADVNDFGAGVAFAVDSGVDIVSEALGALDNTPFARAAVEYAWDNGVPIVASAADEQSYHHNYPSAYDHVLWVNSIRPEDGFLVKDPTNLLFNGCTNYSGQATVAIASTSCSSEATEKAAGIMALLFSAAKNEIDRGNLSPHPITGRALSPSEAYQLMTQSADDIDFSSDLSLTIDPLLPLVSGIPLYSERVPTHAGYDKYTGYGRANAATAVAKVGPGTIPPEAYIASPGWFETIDPTVTPLLDIDGTVAAQRDSNDFTYTVDWACGVDPLEADYLLPGHTLYSTALSGTWIDDGLLAMLDTTTVETECGFDTLTLPRADEDDFDESFAITLRVRVEDSLGNDAEHRKNVFVYTDPTARTGFPKALGVSGESAPVLADVDGDDDQEIVMATADGDIHVLQEDGSELAGFPAQTEPMPLETGAAAYQPGALGSDFHNAVLGSVAVGDLEPDGSPEIVAVDMEGYVYVFESDGSMRPGFPVTLDPTYSDPAIRDEANRLDMAAAAAPTLADIDLDGDLEILVAAADRHLYVWDDDGSQHPGFPVLVVDQERMQSVDPVTHKVVWKDATGGGKVGSIGTKLVGSPSVGDIDGDGNVEIVLGSNEEYVRDETANFFIPGSLFIALSTQLDLPNGRLYAISHLGNDDPAVQDNPSGPFLPGWPVKVGLALADVLPTVGHGVNGNPVLADIDDDGDDEIFINPSNGPAILLQGDGTSVFGTVQGKFQPFDTSVLPEQHPGSDTVDFPLSIPILGSGVVGDLNDDAVLDFVVPGAGAGQLLDNLGPALQGPSDQQLLAYSSANRKVLPAFPRRMEDLQFLTNPTIADIDGDGVADVMQGSGGYYLHAFGGTGGDVPGWPKFTGGWTIGAIAVGDLDNDGLIDLVAATREGNLYAWEETGSFGTNGRDPVQWATLARDARHSGNVNSGVKISGAPSGCETMYRAVVRKVNATYKPAANDDKIKVKGFVNMPGRAIDPPTEVFRVAFGDPDAPTYTAEVPIGDFTGNKKGTSYKFKDKTLAVANGLKSAKLKLKKGIWNFDFQAKDVDAEWLSDVLFVSVQVGDVCMQRVRGGCEIKSNGKKLQCK